MFCQGVVNAFHFLSYGEAYINEKIDSFPWDQEGMKRMWGWYGLCSKNVMDFLRESGFGENDSSIICDFHMDSIYEKLAATQDACDSYCSRSA